MLTETWQNQQQCGRQPEGVRTRESHLWKNAKFSFHAFSTKRGGS